MMDWLTVTTTLATVGGTVAAALATAHQLKRPLLDLHIAVAAGLIGSNVSRMSSPTLVYRTNRRDMQRRPTAVWFGLQNRSRKTLEDVTLTVTLPAELSPKLSALYDDDKQIAKVFESHDKVVIGHGAGERQILGGMTCVTYDEERLRPNEAIGWPEFVFTSDLARATTWIDVLADARSELLYERAAAVKGCLGACVMDVTVCSRETTLATRQVCVLWIEAEHYENVMREIIIRAWGERVRRWRWWAGKMRPIQSTSPLEGPAVQSDTVEWFNDNMRGSWSVGGGRFPRWGLNGERPAV